MCIHLGDTFFFGKVNSNRTSVLGCGRYLVRKKLNESSTTEGYTHKFIAYEPFRKSRLDQHESDVLVGFLRFRIMEAD